MQRNKFRTGDIVLAAVGVLLALAYTLSPTHGVSGIAQAFLSWLFVPFLSVWRSRPAISATGFLALLAAWAATWIASLPENSGVSPWLLTAPMAVFTTTRSCANRMIPRLVLAVTFAGVFLSPVMWALNSAIQLEYRRGADMLITAAAHWFLLISVYLGAMWLRRRTEEAEKRRQAAQAEERGLIAREVHDILAHSLTLMKVQANAGIITARKDPAGAVEALKLIRNESDAALTEVRALVEALRTTSTTQTMKQLADLEEIIAGFRATGLTITSSLPDNSDDVSALTQLAATRIVTEALTNALRHQGKGTAVEVIVEKQDDLHVKVTSRNPTPTTLHQGSGTGLVGLRERAETLGGQLTTSGNQRLFTLTASLPRRTPA